MASVSTSSSAGTLPSGSILKSSVVMKISFIKEMIAVLLPAPRRRVINPNNTFGGQRCAANTQLRPSLPRPHFNYPAAIRRRGELDVGVGDSSRNNEQVLSENCSRHKLLSVPLASAEPSAPPLFLWEEFFFGLDLFLKGFNVFHVQAVVRSCCLFCGVPFNSVGFGLSKDSEPFHTPAF